MKLKKTPLALTFATVLQTGAVTAQDNSATNDVQRQAQQGIERISVLGSQSSLRNVAGSVTVIDELALEKYEYDDIARILANVPGVNIRQEDGYGLRPNIGFRGVTPERSKKINIMEDGVLIGPAPYSAPAAYYFPMVSRMSSVEVVKGPSAIKFGPNTVAGALNLVTRQIPLESEGGLDISAGSDGYAKGHVYYGDTNGNFGYLLEGLHVQADGFKQLDGGGDTGFDKNEVMSKFNYRDQGKDYVQYFELKLAYSDETSDETYLGLTDEDFSKNPLRRYSASQLGLMNWDHSQVQFTHHIEWSGFDVTTRVYRNDFERSWRKINGFTASQGSVPTLQNILSNPGTEDHQPYYQVLTGQRDSSLREILVIGTNQREYYSQDVQVDFGWSLALGGLEHRVEGGIRYHQDEIRRDHIEDNFFMRSSKLVTTGENTRPASTNTEQTDATSVYIQDTVKLEQLEVTAGVRGEFIRGDYQNRATGQDNDWQKKSFRVWLPSLSAFYHLDDTSGVLFGVHQGFVPSSPIQPAGIKAEKSVNYELGWRYADNGTRAELIGFFNDFSNLSESCSFSTAASCAANGQLDRQFNGGEVDVYGLEASMQSYVKLSSTLSMPWSLVYTHTQSEFKQALNSDFALWGDIRPGDEVPYLADNTVTGSIGLSENNWQVSLLVSYTGEMKEAAGRGVALSGLSTKAYTVLDLSASYDLGEIGKVYLKADNLLDKVEIASRRPYGARPSKPQQFFVGYKYSF